MTVRRFTLVLALLAFLTAGVSANDQPAPKSYAFFGRWFSGPQTLLFDPNVQEATGMEAEPLREALLQGSTLNELIAVNGGAAETVIADLVAQASDAINAQATAAITSLEENFTESMNDSHRRRFPWWRRRNPVRELFGAWNMDETVMAATGLDKAELNTALLEGSTIAELIKANDGDVASVGSTLVQQATDGINEAAAARIQRHAEMFADAFDTDFSDRSRRWRKWRPRHGAFFSYWGAFDNTKPETNPADSS
ncbi:MAG: hypothetical protein OXI30_11105 [Chloroflexota bacterium]|nr:hypothetical protein [Chloroflexota bacterium]